MQKYYFLLSIFHALMLLGFLYRFFSATFSTKSVFGFSRFVWWMLTLLTVLKALNTKNLQNSRTTYDVHVPSQFFDFIVPYLKIIQYCTNLVIWNPSYFIYNPVTKKIKVNLYSKSPFLLILSNHLTIRLFLFWQDKEENNCLRYILRNILNIPKMPKM